MAIIGPNGSGKSTLLKTVYGLVPLRHGAVTLFAPEGAHQPSAERRHRASGSTWCRSSPMSSRALGLENLEIGALAVAASIQWTRGWSGLRLFPLLEERKGRGATLSGGQRQMLAFGRALMSVRASSSSTSPRRGSRRNPDEVFAKVKEVNCPGVSILMVEQKARRALALSDRDVFDLGQNKFTGPGPELIADPKVADLYLGGGAGAPRLRR